MGPAHAPRGDCRDFCARRAVTCVCMGGGTCAGACWQDGDAGVWGCGRAPTRTIVYVHTSGAVRVPEAGGLAPLRSWSFPRQPPAAHTSASSSFPPRLASSTPIQSPSLGLGLRGACAPHIHKTGKPVASASLSFPIYNRCHLAGNGWNQGTTEGPLSSALLWEAEVPSEGTSSRTPSPHPQGLRGLSAPTSSAADGSLVCPPSLARRREGCQRPARFPSARHPEGGLKLWK